ncbi:MAG: hypothetical protein U5S82_04355 [Gammaproteobacteria bacterium]|nr:hypothetical protein [Gammaproteobacteria bacterium]
MVLKFRGGKLKSLVVRKLSQFSQATTRNAFRQSRNLRHLSMGGAFVGMGLILLLSVIYDKLKARAQRAYSFVDTNYDTAGRAWKRQPEIQERILRDRFWRPYELALSARDIKPPYDDRESFLRLARHALEADLPLLEDHNAAGQPSRIPFRQAQKLFASPPFSTHKNSVNDLRFSWYRDIRDRHLGPRRYLMDLTQSSPFENYLLIGFRRDMVTMISRGLKKSASDVRLEDVLGTSRPDFIGEECQVDRDKIRAFTARKILPRTGNPRDAVWRVLEDGLGNVVKEIVLADPMYLTGEFFIVDEQGQFASTRVFGGMISELTDLVDKYGPVEKKCRIDFDDLHHRANDARTLTGRLLEFLATNDPDKVVVQDLGDLRAVRVALQIDLSLQKKLLNDTEPRQLLDSFSDIRQRQADYDRALIELRGVYESCLADFELYNLFLEENFSRYFAEYPEADYDPWWAKVFLILSRRIRRASRRFRQKLQFR